MSYSMHAANQSVRENAIVPSFPAAVYGYYAVKNGKAAIDQQARLWGRSYKQGSTCFILRDDKKTFVAVWTPTGGSPRLMSTAEIEAVLSSKPAPKAEPVPTAADAVMVGETFVGDGGDLEIITRGFMQTIEQRIKFEARTEGLGSDEMAAARRVEEFVEDAVGPECKDEALVESLLEAAYACLDEVLTVAC